MPKPFALRMANLGQIRQPRISLWHTGFSDYGIRLMTTMVAFIEILLISFTVFLCLGYRTRYHALEQLEWVRG